MNVTIAKVDETLYSGDAASVTCPAEEGEVTILPNHESLVTRLKDGVVTVRPTDGEAQTISIDGGVLEVSFNSVVLMVQ